MKCGRVIAVLVLFLAIVLYRLIEPLPPNTANPVTYRILAGLSKARDDFARLQSWLTGEDYRLIEQRHFRAVGMAMRSEDADVLVTEEKFDGVQVYIYRPKTTKSDRGALMFFHGGGFRTGHPVLSQRLFFRFVKELDIVVVGVRYRLTPTVKAPVPHEDCMTATRYFFANAGKYGVNPDNIGAAGGSAGGNLAASVALQLRDERGPQLLYQILIYPWVQGLDVNTPSYQKNCPSAFVLMTHRSMVSFLGSFLGLPEEVFPDIAANRHVKPETWKEYKKYFNLDEIPKESMPANYKEVRPEEINQTMADFVEDDITNPYLWPLLADDLSALPPAYILTVENDPIRDEGIWYANRLKRAGNKVFHEHSADGFHGMLGFQAPPIVFDPAIKAADNMVKFAKQIMNRNENGKA